MEVKRKKNEEAPLIGNPIKVFLVEDDAHDRELVRKALPNCFNPSGFRIDSVGTISESIEYIGQNEYDIILLDLNLPDSSGIETIQRIRDADPKTPIVVLTGIEDEETGIEAIEKGATDYLIKNQSLDHVLTRVIHYSLARKKSEDDRLKSETKYRIIFESSRDAVMTLSPKNLRFRSANPATLKMFRCKDERQFISRTTVEFSPEYQPDGKMSIAKAHEMLTVCLLIGSNSFEWRHKRLNGEEFPANVQLTRFSLAGEMLVQATVRDISVRKKREQRLLETNLQLNETTRKLSWAKEKLDEKVKLMRAITSQLEQRVEDRSAELLKANQLLKNEVCQRKKVQFNLEAVEKDLRKIITTSPDGIVVVDRNGIVQFVNPAAELLLGRQAKDLVGESFGLPVNNDETTEINVLHSDAEMGIAEMKVVEMLWDGQESYLIMLRDITDRKRSEEKLTEANEKISEYGRLKDEFVSTASHELRTPLTIILGAIRLVLDEIPGKIVDEQKNILSIAKENVQRLSNIVNSLLSISKIESGKMDLNKQVVNVSEHISKTISDYENVANEKGISLTCELPEEEVDVWLDPFRISEVLTNLISNSLKFTPEQGWIKVSCFSYEGEIQIKVQDSGIGIAQEDIPKLFEKFTQFGRNAGSGEKGTGLGLSIVKQLVELHDGKIEVQSKAGEGTTFTISLPKVTEIPAESCDNETDELIENALASN